MPALDVEARMVVTMYGVLGMRIVRVLPVAHNVIAVAEYGRAMHAEPVELPEDALITPATKVRCAVVAEDHHPTAWRLRHV